MSRPKRSKNKVKAVVKRRRRRNAVPKAVQPIRVTIAVVMTKGDHISKRNDGSWSCFLGEDRQATIEVALERAEQWSRNSLYGPYVVGVGTLEEYAVPVKRVPFRVEKV